jgi:hypothetical protein
MSLLWDKTLHFPNLIAKLHVPSSALCEITLTTFHIWTIHHVRTTAYVSCGSINNSVLTPLLHRDASISVFCDILLTVAHVCCMTIHASILISFLHWMPLPVLLWHPTKNSTCLLCDHTHQCSNLYATMNDCMCFCDNISKHIPCLLCDCTHQLSNLCSTVNDSASAFVITLLSTAHVCCVTVHTSVLISFLHNWMPPPMLLWCPTNHIPCLSCDHTHQCSDFIDTLDSLTCASIYVCIYI